MDPQTLLSRLRTLASAFSTSQLVTLAGTFVLVVGIVAGSAWWLNAPTYVLMYSDMDAESMQQVVTRLKAQDIPYRLDDGGRGIRVPQGRVDELRLELSAESLPASGRVGFEIFDRTQFGATQFLEQVNYRRALEGEIARTIGTISEVSNARVHIAMGKDSLFGEPRPAKASVVLKLRGSRPPSAATIAGIGNLVASSVEGLRPESVVILDSYGRPLARPQEGDSDPLGAAHMERQQRLEREMSARVVALLEPVVGPDRVRVNVAIKLDAQSLEETEERWDPNTVVRSRQASADQAIGTGVAAVAGARGNAPVNPDAPAPPQQAIAGPNSSRSSETTNFEVSRTTRHVIQPRGDVERLSVAVILDDDQATKQNADGSTQIVRKPRTPEELQKIQALVAAAVGLETDRGDHLTVENVSFDEPVVEQGPPPSMLEKYSPQIWEGSRIAAVALIGGLALLVFVRPLMRRAGAGAAQKELAVAAAAVPALALATATGPKTVAELENDIDEELNAVTAQYAEARRLPVLTRRVSSVTINEPENVAKLLRQWIADTER
ncbi:MAG TPA: flagellar basal-body MS-ring/collar protein FliF [Vicinamibacterales bacterium]